MYRHPAGKPEEKSFTATVLIARESVEFCCGLG
jgi:hypothetical protein